ncbi:MAG: FAD-binding oxidoreductase [Chloroflexi bacterium]|nr:FAD-binding oxidoreductase [Chloroflexota bacterium]
MPDSKAKRKIVVIGAGIVGASISFNLSRRPDIDLTLIDRSQPGSGATGHSFAWLNSFSKEPDHYHDLNRRSLNMWDRFARRIDAQAAVTWGGELRWVSEQSDATELRGRVDVLQRRGYGSRMISEEELKELEPGLNVRKFAGAEFSEHDGHIDGPAIVEACMRRVKASGATVLTDTDISGLKKSGESISGVMAGGREIPCDVVVLAAGLGVTGLAEMAGVAIPQQKSPGVVGKTTPLPPIFKSVAILHTPPLNAERGPIHMRQMADGTLMIGEGSQESVSSDDSQEHADDMLARAIERVPAIRGASITPVPVGYRPMPMDGLPILGFTRAVPNMYVAVMHSGVTLAALVGEFAAIEIADGAPVDLFEPYRLERFKG